jgi:Family of unknown function (DUF6279)
MNKPRSSRFPSLFQTGARVWRHTKNLFNPATKKCIALCLLVVTLTGCSQTTFFYNRLDWILPWYVEDYAELDQEQERYLDDQLSPFLSWHRESELPCYIDLIDHIDLSVEAEVSPQDIELIAEALENAWYRTQDETLDWLLDLGEQLSEQQVQDFLAKLDEKQREAEEKYLGRSDEEFQEDNYDTLHNIAKDYLGKLTPTQREQLHDVSKTLRRSDTLWLEERTLFNQRLAEVLQRKPDWQKRARELVETRMTKAPEEYLEIVEYNAAVIQEWVVLLVNGRTDKQDARLQKRLAKLRGDFEKLVAQAEDPSSCAVGLI